MCTAFGAPAAVHHGDLELWDAACDFQAKQFMRSVADLQQNPQELQNHLYAIGMFGAGPWNVLLKRVEVTRALIRAAGFTWATVDRVIDSAPKSVTGSWRPRGETTEGRHIFTVENVAWACRLCCICPRPPGADKRP